DENGVPTFGSSAYVYEPYFLLLSYLEMRNHSTISFPNDIENIIEKVYGKQAGPWPSPAFEKAVYDAKEKMDEEAARAQYTARGNVVSNEEGLLDKFNRQLEEDNPEIHHSLQALTRLTSPSVQVICLCRSAGAVFLHESDLNPLDIEELPRGEVLDNLLRRSMSISDKRVIFKLTAQEPPASWKKCPALRHHRLLTFENGIARVGKYSLHLDSELGLYIEGNED
ncbi:MAG: hypothetical protein J7M15_07385, partial [Anaerolineae bacterium]|nr:hypothetical protein [Anaerolineae bacterium]